MKCPTCNKGKLEKITDKIKEDNVEYEAYRCSSCKEEIMDMKQLGSLAKRYRDLRQAKAVTFAKWGNSIAVRIPNEIAKEYSIKSGKQGLITKDKNGIKIITS